MLIEFNDRKHTCDALVVMRTIYEIDAQLIKLYIMSASVCMCVCVHVRFKFCSQYDDCFD